MVSSDGPSISLDDQAVLLNFESDRVPNPQIDEAHNVKFLGAWPVPADGMKAWETGGVVVFAWDLNSSTPHAGRARRRRRQISGPQQLEPPLRLPIGAMTIGLWMRWAPLPDDGMDAPVSEILSFSGGHSLKLYPSGLGIHRNEGAHTSCATSAQGRRVSVPRDVWMALFLVISDVSAGICNVYGSWDDTGAHLLGELDALPLGAEFRCLGGGPIVGFLTQLTIWSRAVTVAEQAQWFLSRAARYGICVNAKEPKSPEHKDTHDFFQLFQTVSQAALSWRERAPLSCSSRAQKTLYRSKVHLPNHMLTSNNALMQQIPIDAAEGLTASARPGPDQHIAGNVVHGHRSAEELTSVSGNITERKYEKGSAVDGYTSRADGTETLARQGLDQLSSRTVAPLRQAGRQLTSVCRNITDGMHEKGSATAQDASVDGVSSDVTGGVHGKWPAADVDTNCADGTQVSPQPRPHQHARRDAAPFRHAAPQLSRDTTNITDTRHKGPAADENTNCADGTQVSPQPRPHQHACRDVAPFRQAAPQLSRVTTNITHAMHEKKLATDDEASHTIGTTVPLGHRLDQQTSRNITLFQQVGQQLSGVSTLFTHGNSKRPAANNDTGRLGADEDMGSTCIQLRADEHAALVQQATRLLVCECSSESGSDGNADQCENFIAGANDADDDCQLRKEQQHLEMPAQENHGLQQSSNISGQDAMIDATKITSVQGLCQELAGGSNPCGVTLRLPKAVRHKQQALQKSWSRGQLVEILAWSCANSIMRQGEELSVTGDLGVSCESGHQSPSSNRVTQPVAALRQQTVRDLGASCESGHQMPFLGRATLPVSSLQQHTILQPSWQSTAPLVTATTETYPWRNGASKLCRKQPLNVRIRNACMAVDRNHTQLRAQRGCLDELGSALKALKT